MNKAIDHDDESLLALTADVVASFVSYNSLSTKALPALIGDVHAALRALKRGLRAPTSSRVVSEYTSSAPVPALPIADSVTPELIYCLENGRGFRTLKKHLRSAYGMTPDQYREKWNLPADYPMVAPAYSVVRSAWAVSGGLGTSARSRWAKPQAKPTP
ncbi:MucR family transcriptional regulator [Kaistia sp. MMO-174]|uniref:MucR family transcriptional regulator n=1 Tax=Kaistia sp. MMO-174 TaxID=3081256 RepID=UPI00301B0366